MRLAPSPATAAPGPPTSAAPAPTARKPVTRRSRRRGVGLRARVTIGFALAGLLVSVALAFITYSLARSYLLDQRDTVARQQAFVNARLVRDVLRNPVADPGQLVSSIRTEAGGAALFQYNDQWYVQSARFSQGSLPDQLRSNVLAGGTGWEHFSGEGEPLFAVGVYVAEPGTAYFEVFSFAGLDRTLGVIGTSLAIGATITTGLAAFLGWWASRRLLWPLSRVADAAEEIASGGLDTRLEEANDRDLDRLVGSFNNMADALQSRIEREARFASDVSHELRSPITALAAAVGVLDTRREELPPRSRQALDVVVNQVHRFEQMVLDLLEISRLDAGALELHKEPVVIGSLVARIVAHTGNGSVPVDVEPMVAGRIVEVDKRRLERVLANLLGNADAHAGGAVRVSVEAAGTTRVRIGVEDAGPGVPAAERARIFERFARGATARHRSGTGLGLALVAEHAALHGGRAWVEDRPGGGARFVVELPAVIE